MTDNNNTGTFRRKPLFFKEKAPLVKILLEEILWIEAIGGLISVHTVHGRFTIRETIKEITNMLPKGRFLRVHRSYVVPLDKITQVNEKSVVVSKMLIPVGESYRALLKKSLRQAEPAIKS